ncbi:MAG TPA: Asp-tRNA(Asn)/Glu-tRNA(Gln) amidotransferase GatCAB subunit B, partial [Bacillota bacterium]|nr:Asp-tRNA(Asn)/Glu-tRNA(Gln) amidotransferase GatCAB subunit B [Bacillota bacterium]
PDLGPIVIDRAWVEKIRGELPELPDAKAERYMREWDLPKYDACQIADSADLSDLFEKTCAIVGEGREVAKWILGEVMASLNATGIELSESKLTPELFAELIDLMTTGKISGKIAKSVFEDVFSNGRRPSDIVKERGLLQISDVGELVTIVEKVIDANPGPVADYHAGKERALGFLVGQVMKETRGRANPQETNRILREELDKRA